MDAMRQRTDFSKLCLNKEIPSNQFHCLTAKIIRRLISSHEINIDDKVNTKHEEIVFCHSNFVEKVKKNKQTKIYISHRIFPFELS